jgi:hypothetical protein
MLHLNCRLVFAALILAMTAGAVAAQQTSPPASAAVVSAKPHARADEKVEPSALGKARETWGQTKDMSRKEWNAAKKKWAQEKVKWRTAIASQTERSWRRQRAGASSQAAC